MSIKQLYLIAVFFIVSCDSAVTPQEVAQGYLDSLAHLDFSRASSYVTEQGRPTFERLGEIWNQLPREEQTKFQITNWVIDEVDVNGTEATVTFHFDGDKRGQLILLNDGRQWRVDQRRTL